jgi:hypothetical protein
MKTYKKTIDKPRLEIRPDEFMENPRKTNEGTVGYFITVDRSYLSPDEDEQLEEIVRETGQVADSQADHIERIIKEIEEYREEKVLEVYPITKYEHSGVVYKLGSFSGFDYSNNGFYIITDKTQKRAGVKKKDFEKAIEDELEDYNKWINGEYLEYVLYDKNGEVEDSCVGVEDLERVRELLPKEFQNEDLEEYLIFN